MGERPSHPGGGAGGGRRRWLLRGVGVGLLGTFTAIPISLAVAMVLCAVAKGAAASLGADRTMPRQASHSPLLGMALVRYVGYQAVLAEPVGGRSAPH